MSTIHYLPTGRNAACRVNMRFSTGWTERFDRATCKACKARVADAGGLTAYLSTECNFADGSRMDTIHENALEIEHTRKANARRKWETEMLVSLCHGLAQADDHCICGHYRSEHSGRCEASGEDCACNTFRLLPC